MIVENFELRLDKNFKSSLVSTDINYREDYCFNSLKIIFFFKYNVLYLYSLNRYVSNFGEILVLKINLT